MNVYVHNIYVIKLRSSFQAILLPHSTIVGLTDTSTEHFLMINHLLLIYKCYLYKVRDSQNLSFLTFKKNIIKIKTLEEKTCEERKLLNSQNTFFA